MRIFKRQTDTSESETAAGEAPGYPQIDPRTIVASMPSACALLDREGNMIQANRDGARIVAAIRQDASSLREFSLLLAETVLRGKVTQSRFAIPAMEPLPDDQDTAILEVFTGNQAAELTLLPLMPAKTGVLLLVNDITFSQNLTSALSSSRALYRDLVNCSSDFCWETDVRGSFVFVGPKGALGFSSHELNGMAARSLVLDAEEDGFSDGVSVFSTPVAVQNVEICLRHKAGFPAYYVVSAVPVFDEKGHWKGVRGAGRDVSDLRTQQLEIDRANRQREVVHGIVQATRANIDPNGILEEAAQAVLTAFQSEYCALYRVTGEGQIVDACIEAIAPDAPRSVQDAQTPAPYQMLSQLRRSLGKGVSFSEFIAGGWHILSHLTAFRDQTNGIVVLARRANRKIEIENEQDLLQEVSAHLGLTFAQVQHTLELQEHSRKDPLTNLLNRRAFMSDAETRIEHHRRHHRPSALLFLDLDNFKTINDQLGHSVGDRVLSCLAKAMIARVRANDLIVRFGGDEFGILLEESDAGGAIAKATQLFEAQSEIRMSAELPFDLAFSIGIAIIDPSSDDPLEKIMDRADKALYQAKAKGKNQWCLSSASNAILPVAQQDQMSC